MCIAVNAHQTLDQGSVIAAFLAISRAFLAGANRRVLSLPGSGQQAPAFLGPKVIAWLPAPGTSRSKNVVRLADRSPDSSPGGHLNDAQIRREVSRLMKKRNI